MNQVTCRDIHTINWIRKINKTAYQNIQYIINQVEKSCCHCCTELVAVERCKGMKCKKISDYNSDIDVEKQNHIHNVQQKTESL